MKQYAFTYEISEFELESRKYLGVEDLFLLEAKNMIKSNIFNSLEQDITFKINGNKVTGILSIPEIVKYIKTPEDTFNECQISFLLNENNVLIIQTKDLDYKVSIYSLFLTLSVIEIILMFVFMVFIL